MFLRVNRKCAHQLRPPARDAGLFVNYWELLVLRGGRYARRMLEKT
jgi:hypothetical protein